MEITKINTINFSKKLIAKASVIKAEKPTDCQIFLLEKGKDWNYFGKQGKIWQKAEFLQPVEAELESERNYGFFDSNIYVIEDSKGKCLGYCEVDTDDKTKDILTTIETNPRYKAKNKERTIKYIGETLLAYLAQNTRNKGKNILSIHSPTKEAENFYTEKCGFKKTGKNSGLEISNEAFDQLINQNSEHTKGKIQVVI